MSDTRFFDARLVSDDFRLQLRADVRDADLLRFVVAYVSEDGLEAIGKDGLVSALRMSGSFGVSSLSCETGFNPLLNLSGLLGDEEPRLRYFLDPMVRGRREADTLHLLHPKLVYLVPKHRAHAVVYIGSHNWSLRALGPGKPRNSEASLRLEIPFSQENLWGEGSGLGAEINRHLLSSFRLQACFSATPENESVFRDWMWVSCQKQGKVLQLEEVVVILTLLDLSHRSSAPTARDWSALKGESIYLQTLLEKDGHPLWQAATVLVLVWPNQTRLEAAEQPVLLICRASTMNAGPDSSVAGSNTSSSPIEGFVGLIWDRGQLRAREAQADVSVPPLTWLPGGQGVETFDFQWPSRHSTAAQVDRGVQPKYQYNLEVEDVALPQEWGLDLGPGIMAWRRATLAMSSSRSAKFVKPRGYRVDGFRAEAIIQELKSVFGLGPRKARILPVSERSDPRTGRAVSSHPLHQTYIPFDQIDDWGGFYGPDSDVLVADFEGEGDRAWRQEELFPVGEPLARVQVVNISPLDVLRGVWTGRAQ